MGFWQNQCKVWKGLGLLCFIQGFEWCHLFSKCNVYFSVEHIFVGIVQIKMNFLYHLCVDKNIFCSLYKISSTSASGNLGTLLPMIAASPRCSPSVQWWWWFSDKTSIKWSHTRRGGPPPAHWRPPLTHPPWRGWPPHAVCRDQRP